MFDYESDDSEDGQLERRESSRAEDEGSGDSSAPDNEHENSEEEEQPFNITLAASHSYMGGLAAVSGRSAREAGWVGRVAAAAHHGAVFPGETVPMLFTDARDIAAVTDAIERDEPFGLLCPDESGALVSGYGVLCEVFEAGAADEPRASLAVKARATRRFRCLQPSRRSVPVDAYARMRPTEVRVLPDVRRGEPLRHARLASLDALRRSDRKSGERARSMDAALTPWPHFVYDIFDYRRLRRVIEDYFGGLGLGGVPEGAVPLSFWTASNLALTARDRLALFAVDDALLRLHMEVRFIRRREDTLSCATCATEVALHRHVVAMSSEGVHANYANPGGYLHDVVTVSQTRHTEPTGAASAEFSWFPGYAWTVLTCAYCSAYVGWRFDALRPGLRPRRFYGLSRNSLQPLALRPSRASSPDGD